MDWERIQELGQEVPSEQLPRVTVVVPTYNDAKKIAITLESIIFQEYPDFEVLVIDAASTDRTIEIVKSFQNEKIRLSSVSGYNRYEMLNKGIFLAKGTYINFVFPGDFYLTRKTMQTMMSFAVKKQKPLLVYSGCLLREAQKEVKIFLREFDLAHLKIGQQPTSLQSCWFRRGVFQEIGKFNTHYQLRGGFDLFCRFIQHENLTHAVLKNYLIDYDLRDATKEMIIRHFYETARIIFKHFGFFAALRWLFLQKDISRYFSYWVQSFKKSFNSD